MEYVINEKKNILQKNENGKYFKKSQNLYTNWEKI